MPNAVRNKQPLQSETGGACSPSPPPGPWAAQKCSSTFSEPLLVSITADSSQFCTGCPITGMGRRQDSLRCVSQRPLLTLAPAMLKQQNQAGNSGSVFTGPTAHRQHQQSHPEERILPHRRSGSPQPRFQLRPSETKTIITDWPFFVSATEILPSYWWFPQKLRPSTTHDQHPHLLLRANADFLIDTFS